MIRPPPGTTRSLRAKAMAAEPAVGAADAELAEPAASAALPSSSEPAAGAADAEFAEPAASLAEGGAPLAGAMSPLVRRPERHPSRPWRLRARPRAAHRDRQRRQPRSDARTACPSSRSSWWWVSSSPWPVGSCSCWPGCRAGRPTRCCASPPAGCPAGTPVVRLALRGASAMARRRSWPRWRTGVGATLAGSGTAHAPRCPQPHLSGLLRPARDAADHEQGPARQRRLRLLVHRPARLRRHEARPRHVLLRRGPLVPRRPLRGLQGHAPAHAGRPARPVPHRARDAGGLRHPRPRDGRLRGGRPHRLAVAAGRAARPGDHHRLGRPGHAAAGHRADQAHDDPPGRPVDRHLRPGAHPRALRPGPGPDDRLQGAQGRLHGQHPGHPRGGRQDGRQAARRLRLAGGPLRAPRRGQAGQAARQAQGAPRRRPALARAGDHRPPGAHRAGPRRCRASATTTAPRSSASSASTSSARSSTACRARPWTPARRSPCWPPSVPGRTSAQRPPRQRGGGGQRAAADARLRRRGGRCQPARAGRGTRRAIEAAAGISASDAGHRRASSRLARLPRVLADPSRRRGRTRRRSDARGLAGGPAGARRGRRLRRPAAAPRDAHGAGRGRRRWSPRGSLGRGRHDLRGRGPGLRAAARRPRGQAAPRLGAGPPRPDRERLAERLGRTPAGRRLRHPGGGLHPQRRPAQPVAGRHLRRAPGRRPARPPASSTPWPRRPSQAAAVGAAQVALAPALEADPALRRILDELELPLEPVLADMEATGVALDRASAGRAGGHLQRGHRPAGGGHLRLRRPRVQPGQPQAARAGPLLRAGPAARQAHQDGLLDGRPGARGAARGAPHDPPAPRLAHLHEAALHLRRGPAAAHRPAHRPAAHDVPAGRGVHRAASRRSTPTSRTSPSARSSVVASAAPSWPAARTSSCWPPTTARSSCASWPTSPATCTCARPSSSAPTSIARRRPACSRRTPRRSRPPSAPWPRWSTSAWPTA